MQKLILLIPLFWGLIKFSEANAFRNLSESKTLIDSPITTKVLKDGKITQLNYDKELKSFNIDSSKLKVASKAEIDQMKTSFEKLFTKSANVLRPLDTSISSKYKFYSELWGDTALNRIKSELDIANMDYPNKFLLTEFYANIPRPDSFLYKIKTEDHVLTISKGMAMNSFMVKYYNSLIPEIPTLTLKQKFDYEKSMQISYLKICNLLKLIEQDVDPLTHYSQADSLLVSLHSNNSDYQKIKVLLQNDWYKKWFWFNSGTIKLNPLDFTTAEYVSNHPETDILKSEIFNTYIDTIINKYMRYDTTGHVEQFLNILNLKGKGKDYFSFKKLIDSLNGINTILIEKLTLTSVTLNKMTLPKEDLFYVFSAMDTENFRSSLNKKAYLSEATDLELIKNFLVINIPNNSKIDFSEINKPIKDQSNFQKELGVVSEQLLDLAKLALNTTPIDPFLSTLNNNLTNKINGLNLPFTKSKKDTEIINKLNRIPGMLDSLRSDSLMLANFIEIFQNSSLPVTTLPEEKSNDVPIYSSKVYNTTANDSASKKTITLTNITKSDTTVIKKFNYLTGKRSRLLLGVGFAYTIPDSKFYQTRVSSEAGKISVTSTNLPYQFVAGLHVYPFKKGLLSIDNKFIINNSKFNCARFSIMGGVAISKRPLDNLYTAISFDLWPGLKLYTGIRWYRNDKYTLSNNEITSSPLYFNNAFHIGINLDPSAFTNLINVFNQK